MRDNENKTMKAHAIFSYTFSIFLAWWPCLLTDRNEISNLYRGPSIDAFYQVSVYLAEGFQRRRLYSHFNIRFSKPCQRQYELLPSLGVRRLLFVYFLHFNLLL
jgi:hypothetical protein